jgi:isoleucyl-tRNA synthetase
VSWCIHDRTALAEAEVEYEQHTSPSVYVRYRLTSDGGLIVPELSSPWDSVYTIIWTTTPWTLPASVAIAFNPKLMYAALKTPNGTYIIAEALLQGVIDACDLRSAERPLEKATSNDVIARFEGTHLDGTRFQHPFLNRGVYGVLADYVTSDQGTGAVHTAPAHGVDDFATGQRYGIPAHGAVVQYVDDAGRQTDTGYLAGSPQFYGGSADAIKVARRDTNLGPAQAYEGLTVWKSNPVIINLLREKGALLAASEFEHSYPHCWRCHNPVIVRATEQWFIGMDTPMTATDGSTATFRERALAEIMRVKWDPAWGQERITNMVATRPDWCISRQRIWGVPIAVFLCRKCGEPLKDAAINKRVVELFMRESADAWYIHPPEDILPAGTKCACGHTEFRKEMDILDVWFESGASSHAVLDVDADTQQVPGDPDTKNVDPRADLYAEGGDQHRGWFMSSLLCGIGMHNRAPYKMVATYGWTLDEQGRALSKSLGNFIDPNLVMDTLGGDVVRLWVASVDFREDVVASMPLLKRLAEEIYRKQRNTFRFLLGALREIDPATGEERAFDARPMDQGGDSIAFSAMQPIDQYILARAAELTKKIRAAYEAMEFHRVYHFLNEFLNSELSAFYLDVLKDRLYTYPVKFKAGNEYQRELYVARRSAQTAIYKITDALARLTAPILSFTADEVWQQIPGKTGSVHLEVFPEAEEIAPAGSAEFIAEWDDLLKARSVVLNQLEGMRARGEIGKGLGAEAPAELGAPAELNAQYDPVKGNRATRNLKSNTDVLAELFGLSQVNLKPTSIQYASLAQFMLGHPEVSKEPKCERCWRHVPDVGEDERYPSVCKRCAQALDAIDFPPYAAG